MGRKWKTIGLVTKGLRPANSDTERRSSNTAKSCRLGFFLWMFFGFQPDDVVELILSQKRIQLDVGGEAKGDAEDVKQLKFY